MKIDLSVTEISTIISGLTTVISDYEGVHNIEQYEKLKEKLERFFYE